LGDGDHIPNEESRKFYPEKDACGNEQILSADMDSQIDVRTLE
jgi:hypothetical protein